MLAAGQQHTYPGVELRANLKSISHRCHLFEIVFVWELTKETIHLPLGGEAALSQARLPWSRVEGKS